MKKPSETRLAKPAIAAKPVIPSPKTCSALPRVPIEGRYHRSERPSPMPILGIPLRIQKSLVSTLVLGGAFYFALTQDAGRALNLVLGISTVLLAVLMHELGHALVARAFGLEVGEVAILLFGGAARIQAPSTPRQEFWVALAGPLTNLALGFPVLLVAQPAWIPPFDHPPPLTSVWVLTNLMLGFGNLFPAFPMDGGRIFRSLLWRWLGYRDATRWALSLGRILALILMLSVLVDPTQPLLWPLPFLGILILIVGAKEADRLARRDEEQRLRTHLDALPSVAPIPPPGESPAAAIPGETAPNPPQAKD